MNYRKCFLMFLLTLMTACGGSEGASNIEDKVKVESNHWDKASWGELKWQ